MKLTHTSPINLSHAALYDKGFTIDCDFGWYAYLYDDAGNALSMVASSSDDGKWMIGIYDAESGSGWHKIASTESEALEMMKIDLPLIARTLEILSAWPNEKKMNCVADLIGYSGF